MNDPRAPRPRADAARRRFRLGAAAAVVVAAAASAWIVAGSGWAAPTPLTSRDVPAGSSAGMSAGTPIWTWSNGQFLVPTTLTEDEAAQRPLDQGSFERDPGTVTHAHVTGSVFTSDVMDDGTVIGTRDGDVVAMKGGSLRTLARFPTWAEDVWVEGRHIYRTAGDGDGDDAILQEIPLTGGHRELVRLPGGAGTRPLVVGSRVYWTQPVGPAGSQGPGRARVVSRSVHGGRVTVVAQNAQNPVLTSHGVVVQTLGAFEEPFLETQISGLAIVEDDGSQRPLLTFHGWNDGTGIESVRMQTTGHDSLLTIASASTAGLLVVDLDSHRAWNIVRENKDLAVLVYNTGSRVVWTWMEPFAHGQTIPSTGRSGILVFTPGTGTLDLLRGSKGLQVAGARGGAIGWFAPDPEAAPAPEGITDGSGQPDGTVYATLDPRAAEAGS